MKYMCTLLPLSTSLCQPCDNHIYVYMYLYTYICSVCQTELWFHSTEK